MIKYPFPKGFLWGSATSAFQVEGDCTTHDFYDWAIKGRIKDGSNPNDAVLHYRYYLEDLELLREMNHNAARIGLEWARIEPAQGSYAQDALAHYRDELVRMRAMGLKTMVTIHHFANPMWFTALGGWKRRKNIHHYLRFVEKVVGELGDLVDYWLTINEPNTYATYSYYFGIFPPGEKSLCAWLRTSSNLQKAHRRAYELIHRIHRIKGWPEAVVGWSLAWIHFEPYSKELLDRVGKALTEELIISGFMRGVRRYLDFIGIQYYRSDLVKFPCNKVSHPGVPKSKLGWDIMPDRFYLALTGCWRKYRIPIIVTENGVCDDHDELRPDYLVSHLFYLWRAIQDGVDVRGYFHWSTLDNFELVDGVSCRFGLVHIDHDSPVKTRRIKPSGRLYAEIIGYNGLTEQMLEEYGRKFLAQNRI